MNTTLDFTRRAVLNITVYKECKECTPLFEVVFASPEADDLIKENLLAMKPIEKTKEFEQVETKTVYSFRIFSETWRDILSKEDQQKIFISGIERTLQQCLRNDKIIVRENNPTRKQIDVGIATVILSTQGTPPDDEIANCIEEFIVQKGEFQKFAENHPQIFSELYWTIHPVIEEYPYIGETRWLQSKNGKPIYEDTGSPHNERWN